MILFVKVGTEFFLRKEGRERGGGTLREGQTGPIFLTSLNPDRRNRRSTHARGRSRTFCEAGRGSLSGFDPSPVGWFVYLCPVSQIRLVGVSPIGDRFGPPGSQQWGAPPPHPHGPPVRPVALCGSVRAGTGGERVCGRAFLGWRVCARVCAAAGTRVVPRTARVRVCAWFLVRACARGRVWFLSRARVRVGVPGMMGVLPHRGICEGVWCEVRGSEGVWCEVRGCVTLWVWCAAWVRCLI